MKRIGLLGGMSWVSTMPYFRAINEAVNRRGGLEAAELVLYSVNRLLLPTTLQGSESGSFGTRRDSRIRRLLANSWRVARKRSCSAAPKYPCCCARKTSPHLCSIQSRSMQHLQTRSDGWIYDSSSTCSSNSLREAARR